MSYHAMAPIVIPRTMTARAMPRTVMAPAMQAAAGMPRTETTGAVMPQAATAGTAKAGTAKAPTVMPRPAMAPPGMLRPAMPRPVMPQPAVPRTGVSLSAFERQVLGGSNGDGMNACVACCDRWADGMRIGLEWYGRDGGRTSRTFAALQADAARFSGLLTARGIRPGDVVAGLLPRGAERLTVILGTWRAGAVYQPISTDCGPAAIEARINHTGRAAAKLVVTDMANRGNLALIDYCPPVLVVTNGAPVRPGDGDFMAELMSQSTCFAPVARERDDPFVLLVGGRDGNMRPVSPKLGSLLATLSSLQIGLDPCEADVGWDVTDPAWSFDLYFAVIRPLLLGDAAIAHEIETSVPAAGVTPPPATSVDPSRRFGVCQQEEVTVLAA